MDMDCWGYGRTCQDEHFTEICSSHTLFLFFSCKDELSDFFYNPRRTIFPKLLPIPTSEWNKTVIDLAEAPCPQSGHQLCHQKITSGARSKKNDTDLAEAWLAQSHHQLCRLAQSRHQLCGQRLPQRYSYIEYSVLFRYNLVVGSSLGNTIKQFFPYCAHQIYIYVYILTSYKEFVKHIINLINWYV